MPEVMNVTFPTDIPPNSRMRTTNNHNQGIIPDWEWPMGKELYQAFGGHLDIGSGDRPSHYYRTWVGPGHDTPELNCYAYPDDASVDLSVRPEMPHDFRLAVHAFLDVHDRGKTDVPARTLAVTVESTSPPRFQGQAELGKLSIVGTQGRTTRSRAEVVVPGVYLNTVHTAARLLQSAYGANPINAADQIANAFGVLNFANFAILYNNALTSGRPSDAANYIRNYHATAARGDFVR
jgi:hypothetical protein